MLSLGGLTFATPWVLLALVALPVLWWLLRLMPPAPRRLRFPAIRLLFGLDPREETPHRTPPWLIALRLLLAALVILGLAHPLMNSDTRLAAGEPLLMVVDDGWAAAPDWPARARAMDELIDLAARANGPVAILATAPPAGGGPIAATGLLPAPDARRLVQAMAPQPWPTDRVAALAALERLPFEGAAAVVWLSDGIESGPAGTALALAERLQRLGSLRVLREPPEDLPMLQLPPSPDPGALLLRLVRVSGAGERSVVVRAIGEDGRLLTREEVRFPAGQIVAETPLSLPSELRNRLARLAIDGEESAGSVVLVDERWRQRPVGLVGGGREGESQPLLSDLYYLERALAPYSEIRQGSVLDLLQRQLAVLVLADVGALTQDETDRLTSWIERGGVLMRFAGNRLAQNADTLLPVRLRSGERALGGAMSWTRPAGLAPFPAESPFVGLPNSPEVVVRRQVLAEPEPDLGKKTWARLVDGTPLVTAARRGEGWLVLVHTTANTDWSNLSLSGLFVEMLRRVVALSQGVVAEAPAETLPPVETLDGFGRLGEPPATAVPAAPSVLDAGAVGPRHPPGLYGRDSTRRALNLSAGISSLAPIGALPSGVAEGPFVESRELDLKPWLLAAAMLLLLIDTLIAFALRGLLRLRPAAAALLLVGFAASGARAQSEPQSPDDPDAFAVVASSETHLAYVRTGVPRVDATSQAGLQGLSLVLNQRTAVEVPPPLGLDIEKDELAFFPLLYWPVTAEQAAPSDEALRRLNAYLKNGGTILFDTRDQSGGSDSTGNERLRALVHGLDVPPLMPVPPDHVLTKAFYLMQDFPGRWTGGALWVEQSEGRVNDGVSSVIIGGNDWAAAWAIDDLGRPMFAAVPGGERQREMAYRFGVNLVMYALTGNYKSDQVHVPAILERLGQ